MTLLEVLIALVVSTVGLLGALAMLGVILGGGQFSRNATEASILAQSRLEELVILPGVTLVSPLNGTLTPLETQLDAFGRVQTTAGAGVYTRATTWGTTPDGLRRTITVAVSWQDALGRPHAVTATRERSP